MVLERFTLPVRGVRIVDRGPIDADTTHCAQIIPLRPLNRRDVDKLFVQLRHDNDLLVTSALSERERKAFEEAGFRERESLHLLRHNFASNPNPRPLPELKLRTARRSDIDAVLDIDERSFDHFWALDRNGLHAARKATPQHQFVVAVHNSVIVGYAVTGVSTNASFLQRLGVHPNARRNGIGSHLVANAIQWAQSRGATTMLVNTQDRNDPAVALYERCGFELVDEQLKVLELHTNRNLSAPS